MRAILRPGVVAACFAVALLCPGTVSAATVDVEPSLLTADDLPAGMVSVAIDNPTRFDSDAEAFEANGGLVAMNQIWQSDDLESRKGVAFLMDFRILFPTAEDAAAYLVDAEDILSEAVPTNLALVEGDAPIGEGLRHYAGTGESSGVTLMFDNYLFRVGPVVVKEFIGSFERDAAANAAIAQAAADRIAALLLESDVPGASSGPQSSDSPGTIRQWAIGATASSEYTTTDWSAGQATGSPNAPGYGQDPVSWAPLVDPGEPEWIELTYAVSVVPTAVNIWEANGAGFVVRVEAWDEAAGDWLTLWHGTDPTPEQLQAFSPPLSATDVATRRIRVTAGEGAAGWPYIDAVELVGTAAP